MILKNRLQYWAEINGFIPMSQTGFRKNFSCIDNLTILKIKIDGAFQEGKEVLSAFLDVKGAFDNVDSSILLKILAEYNCSKSFLQFVKFITYERKVYTQFTGENYRLIYKGVPQGGVLSPLLYILYVSKILKRLSKDIIVSQFADDIAISIVVTNDEDKKKLVEAIKIIIDKLRLFGLYSAPEKTEIVHFNKKNRLCPHKR